MNEFFEILAPMWEGVATLSLGTVGLLGLSVARYFKKGVFVTNLWTKGESKAVSVFGKDTVKDFLVIAKDIKIKDVKSEMVRFADKQMKIEKMLIFIIKTNLANGVYEDTDLEEEANNLL